MFGRAIIDISGKTMADLAHAFGTLVHHLQLTFSVGERRRWGPGPGFPVVHKLALPCLVTCPALQAEHN